MPATYQLISSNVLTSNQSSVTFSTIPSTYTDLVIQASLRTDASGVVYDSINLTMNGSSSAVYSRTYIRGTGAAATSANGSNNTFFTSDRIGVNGATATSSTFGTLELYILSYTASQNKPFGLVGAGETNLASTVYLGASAGLWRDNSTITSLTFVPQTGTAFVSGSSFYLYGISNA
jgi:hypothetical protein